MAKRRYDSSMGGDESYSAEYERRTNHMQKGGMIENDSAAIANMPQGVMMKAYPKTGPYMPERLDDTLTGVDRQMDLDDSKRASTMYPKKV